MKTLHPSSQFKKDVKRIKIVIALPLTPPFNFFLNIFSAENLQIRKNGSTFASLSERKRAFSSAGSEHLPYKQRVGGSNPSTPTPPRPLPRSFLFTNILQSSKQITLRFKNWKEQIVGYLHDAAEDTPHTVSETIQLLQDKCPNIATKDWEEIETALNLMNSHTAARYRREYSQLKKMLE